MTAPIDTYTQHEDVCQAWGMGGKGTAVETLGKIRHVGGAQCDCASNVSFPACLHVQVPTTSPRAKDNDRWDATPSSSITLRPDYLPMLQRLQAGTSRQAQACKQRQACKKRTRADSSPALRWHQLTYPEGDVVAAAVVAAAAAAAAAIVAAAGRSNLPGCWAAGGVGAAAVAAAYYALLGSRAATARVHACVCEGCVPLLALHPGYHVPQPHSYCACLRRPGVVAKAVAAVADAAEAAAARAVAAGPEAAAPGPAAAMQPPAAHPQALLARNLPCCSLHAAAVLPTQLHARTLVTAPLEGSFEMSCAASPRCLRAAAPAASRSPCYCVKAPCALHGS
eukprot:1150359-Pelagomonas_calceolata.AAC.4